MFCPSLAITGSTPNIWSRQLIHNDPANDDIAIRQRPQEVDQDSSSPQPVYCLVRIFEGRRPEARTGGPLSGLSALELSRNLAIVFRWIVDRSETPTQTQTGGSICALSMNQWECEPDIPIWSSWLDLGGSEVVRTEEGTFEKLVECAYE